MVARQSLTVSQRRLHRDHRPLRITCHPRLHLTRVHQVHPGEQRLIQIDLGKLAPDRRLVYQNGRLSQCSQIVLWVET